MNALLSTARTLTGAATNVATTGLRTGLAVATHASLGVRRFLRPDATAPPVEPVVPDPVVPGPGEPVVPDPGDPGPPPPIPDPAPDPAPATPGKASTPKPKPKPQSKATSTPKSAQKSAQKPKPRKRAADVPLKSEPTPASAAPAEPEGPEVPAEELGTDGATGLAEAQPLLDEATAKQVAAETETLRRAAEQA